MVECKHAKVQHLQIADIIIYREAKTPNSNFYNGTVRTAVIGSSNYCSSRVHTALCIAGVQSQGELKRIGQHAEESEAMARPVPRAPRRLHDGGAVHANRGLYIRSTAIDQFIPICDVSTSHSTSARVQPSRVRFSESGRRSGRAVCAGPAVGQPTLYSRCASR